MLCEVAERYQRVEYGSRLNLFGAQTNLMGSTIEMLVFGTSLFFEFDFEQEHNLNVLVIALRGRHMQLSIILKWA